MEKKNVRQTLTLGTKMAFFLFYNIYHFEEIWHIFIWWRAKQDLNSFICLFIYLGVKRSFFCFWGFIGHTLGCMPGFSLYLN
ncbi:hypothetical protein L873DRAFT_1303639 [Choiromyces venosus 120613-1]|uniref:Uncharacterized protein n=1 Tax=Choiromyces venosus 120613-1 TaxID=1336337 RepID=A0A3N4JB86_9PEZI|nr:hypothetical protein L873DRAFT_1303639 [Choiromyces venosus 120613-1]